MSIVKSTGIPAQVGLVTYGFVGGGNPATKELESTVSKAAELLESAFHQDVEIRYNSNGQSGGAWLKDNLPGVLGSCQIGIGAGLYQDWKAALKRDGLTQDEFWGLGWAGRDRLLENEPWGIVVHAYAKASRLRDTDLATEGVAGEEYAYIRQSSIETALKWLKENCKEESK